jgi:hypothetical protein
VERAVETLIEVLDLFDGEFDLEPNGDESEDSDGGI